MMWVRIDFDYCSESPCYIQSLVFVVCFSMEVCTCW